MLHFLICLFTLSVCVSPTISCDQKPHVALVHADPDKDSPWLNLWLQMIDYYGFEKHMEGGFHCSCQLLKSKFKVLVKDPIK